MSDDRSHVGETHIQRLNDWEGSDSYVEGARRDVGAVDPVPDAPQYPYQLREKAFVDGAIKPPGTVVMLWPHQVGPHHAKLPGVEYPPDPPPPVPPFVPRADYDAKVAYLQKEHAEEVARLNAKIQSLERQLQTAQEK